MVTTRPSRDPHEAVLRDSFFGSRSLPHPRGGYGGRGIPQHTRPGSPCRAVGLPSVLGRRAPQLARDRQRRDGRGHCPRCRGHVHDPGWVRWNHAAQPRPAGDRRAVRNAGVSLSRPDRPRPGTSSRRRPADRSGAAAQVREQRRHVPPRSRRTPQLLPAGRSRHGSPRSPGRRVEHADLAARIERLQCPPRGGARITVCVRVSLRPGLLARCTGSLPAALCAVGDARQAARHGWRERLCGGDRR